MPLRKSDLRRGVADVAFALGGGAPDGPRVVILVYHAVTDGRGDDPEQLAVPLDLFAAQMTWLAELGHPVVSLDAAARALREGAVRGPQVVLTFDDGYRSLYTHAFPVLHRCGYPATAFLVPGVMDGRVPRDFMPAALGPVLSWREARQMQAHGITFGSHTLSHRKLSGLAASEVAREIEESCRAIEDALSAPVTTFCYPYGSFDAFTAETEAVVAGFGFDAVCANIAGHNRTAAAVRRLKRLRISWTDDSRREIAKQCAGAYNWYALYQRCRNGWSR